MKFLLGAIAALVTAASLQGAEPVNDADKSAYNLFNPTPRALLRDLNSDRPDKTEGPFTVDAGWVQVETGLVDFTSDRHNPERSNTRVESWSFGETELRIGILNNVDFEIEFEPYTTTRTVENGAVTHSEGFGDLTFRTTINFWGNDGGSTAFGLIPFVKVPTNQDHLGNHAVEGGLILPFEVKIPGDFDLGMMTEGDINQNDSGSGYHVDWVNSITLGHDLVEHLSAYVEFFSVVSSEHNAPWVGTFDFGFMYQVNKDLQFDCGLNVGLTRSADELNPFVGVTWRF